MAHAEKSFGSLKTEIIAQSPPSGFTPKEKIL